MVEHFINKVILKNKTSSLIFSILFDVLGFVSFVIPIIGEFSDVIWAPIAGYLMFKMYPNKTGKFAGIFVFIEELLPFTDALPTFTLMWLYFNFFKKNV